MASADPRLKSAERKRLRALLGQQWARIGRPCGKCGHPIDYTQAWDLDEIVARVHGGDPEDPANVAAAHVRCNRSAGGRLGNARRWGPRPQPVTSRTW